MKLKKLLQDQAANVEFISLGIGKKDRFLNFFVDNTTLLIPLDLST